MNTRIKELLSQAGFDPDGIQRMGVMSQAERFAQLIIQDCIGVVTGGSFLHEKAPDAIFAKECSRAIEQHFGVE